MRIRHFLMLLLFVCTFLNAYVRSASSQDISNDPNKTAIPTGLNSAINVPSALLAIDDKSPMASSFNEGYGPQSSLLTEAERRALTFLFSIPGKEHVFWGNSEDAFRKFLNQAVTSPTAELQNKYMDFARKDVARFRALQTDLAGPTGYGRFLTNRLYLREYLLYLFPEQAPLIEKYTVFTQGQLDVITEQITHARGTVKKSVYYGTQVRGGGGPTVYAPELIYSNGEKGFDIALQGYVSDECGYGISSRIDLTHGRPEMVKLVKGTDAKRKTAYTTRNTPDDLHPLEVPLQPEEQVRLQRIQRRRLLIADVIAPMVPGGPQNAALREFQINTLVGTLDVQRTNDAYFSDAATATVAVVNNIHSFRLAFLVGERAIFGVGSITNAGLSASQLFACRGQRYNGVTLLFSSHALLYSPDSSGVKATLRNGLAVYWQDRVSRITQDDRKTEYGEINPWGTQVGVEYNFRDGLQANDGYGLFIRQRVRYKVEITVSGGKSANGRGYFGFSLGRSISL